VGKKKKKKKKKSIQRVEAVKERHEYSREARQGGRLVNCSCILATGEEAVSWD